MTQRIFWQDPYLTELKTAVAAVRGDQVYLQSTIFFAFSGGQESDAGTLGGYPVLTAAKDGLDIVYTLPPGHALKAGDPVELRIDWERRYRLMRLHFAAEMILQLVYKHCPGIERIGAHISQDKARIDFARDDSIAVLFPLLEQEAAALVAAGKPIETDFTDEQSQRRYWQVQGFARMGCGGTHPRSTAEIGAFTLKRKRLGKGKERIEITLSA
ncbi:Ser-tRNA(Ala) deacylase AlaX [Collimonas sp. PA-H2]|uniref:alanyl-tRNA editing protein n=1 Tax=Collimonas sp. PA-H2 TaxID=1881062 RepID=UPI000BFAADEC|nr:alanyl-tRNA editing protein [Collimonas sp. PA-H2]PFH04626.1 Ser-tRNA(Ala) deacylase AlaX [Collimonas sp. PA-H2]